MIRRKLDERTGGPEYQMIRALATPELLITGDFS